MHALIPLLTSLILLGYLNLGFAQQDDNDKPLNIEADQLRVDEKVGRSTYSGRVKISRGSLLIKGDKVILQSSDNNGLSFIHVEGSPASFKQNNDKQQLISAEAQELIYRNDSGIITLNKNAVLIQNQNTFRAEEIIYNTHTYIVKAGQKDTSSKTKNGRVFITIRPNNKSTNTP